MLIPLVGPLHVSTAQDDAPDDLPALDAEYFSINQALQFNYPAVWQVRARPSWVVVSSDWVGRSPDRLAEDAVHITIALSTPNDPVAEISPDAEMLEQGESVVIGDYTVTLDAWLHRTRVSGGDTRVTHQCMRLVFDPNPRRRIVLHAYFPATPAYPGGHTETEYRTFVFGLVESLHVFDHSDLQEARAAQRAAWEEHRYTLPGDDPLDYYVIMPEHPPDNTSYVMLVLLSPSGDPVVMLDRFVEYAAYENVVIVAPEGLNRTANFDPIEGQLTALITTVKDEFPVWRTWTGAILFGSSVTASVVSAYAARQPDDLNFVVMENPPILYLPEHDDPYPPTQYILHGAGDTGHTARNAARRDELAAAGVRVVLEIVPGFGHVFMPRAVELTLDEIALFLMG